MRRQLLVMAVLVLAVLGIGTWLYINAQEDQSTDQTANLVDVTAAEVAKHSTEKDCWTIISDKVYDITDYISRHPGGKEILDACGRDGTSLFKERTSSSGEKVGSGTPHSANAELQLQSLLKGNLVK